MKCDEENKEKRTSTAKGFNKKNKVKEIKVYFYKTQDIVM